MTEKRRYRKIDPRIWNDAKFASLSHEAQRTFLFILTHPQMTAFGAFRIGIGGMASELGIDYETFTGTLPQTFDETFTGTLGGVFGELLSKGLVKYDFRMCLVYAPNFLKYNAPDNPNIANGWLSSLDFLPECELLIDVLESAFVACDRFEDKKSKENSKVKTQTFLRTFAERLCKEFGKPLPKGFRNVTGNVTPNVTPNHTPNQITDNRELINKTHSNECVSASAQTPPPKRSKAVPCPEDVTPESWDAWMLVRKSKRCPMTAHALELTRKECEKVGLTLQQAVDEAVLHSWGGFTAEYHESARRLPNGREITVDRKDRKTIFEIAEELNAKAAAEKAAKKAAQKAAEESPFPA